MRITGSDTQVKVAVVGCGRAAQTHLQAISAIEEASLVAVADVNPITAESVSHQFACRFYTDHWKMLDEEELDIICVCTPPVSHSQISIDALSRGVHVLCEKPFAIDLEGARRMVEAADKHGVFITMASKYRFVDDIVKAKGIIESGILGDVVLCEITFCSRVDMQNRWPSNPEVSGGGVLIDNGTHAVDLARYLVGPIARVQALHGPRVQKIPVEDTSMLFFESFSGVWGRVDLSWRIHKESESYINVYGSDGTLYIGWKQSRYRQSERNNWVLFGTGYNKLDAFVKQYRHFIECARGRAKPIIDAVDSLESVRIIEIAYASSRMDKWMEVK